MVNFGNANTPPLGPMNFTAPASPVIRSQGVPQINICGSSIYGGNFGSAITPPLGPQGIPQINICGSHIHDGNFQIDVNYNNASPTPFDLDQAFESMSMRGQHSPTFERTPYRWVQTGQQQFNTIRRGSTRSTGFHPNVTPQRFQPNSGREFMAPNVNFTQNGGASNAHPQGSCQEQGKNLDVVVLMSQKDRKARTVLTQAWELEELAIKNIKGCRFLFRDRNLDESPVNPTKEDFDRTLQLIQNLDSSMTDGVLMIVSAHGYCDGRGHLLLDLQDGLYDIDNFIHAVSGYKRGYPVQIIIQACRGGGSNMNYCLEDRDQFDDVIVVYAATSGSEAVEGGSDTFMKSVKTYIAMGMRQSSHEFLEDIRASCQRDNIYISPINRCCQPVYGGRFVKADTLPGGVHSRKQAERSFSSNTVNMDTLFQTNTYQRPRQNLNVELMQMKHSKDIDAFLRYVGFKDIEISLINDAEMNWEDLQNTSVRELKSIFCSRLSRFKCMKLVRGMKELYSTDV